METEFFFNLDAPGHKLQIVLQFLAEKAGINRPIYNIKFPPLVFPIQGRTLLLFQDTDKLLTVMSMSNIFIWIDLQMCIMFEACGMLVHLPMLSRQVEMKHGDCLLPDLRINKIPGVIINYVSVADKPNWTSTEQDVHCVASFHRKFLNYWVWFPNWITSKSLTNCSGSTLESLGIYTWITRNLHSNHLESTLISVWNYPRNHLKYTHKSLEIYTQITWNLHKNHLKSTHKSLGIYTRITWNLHKNHLKSTHESLGIYTRFTWNLHKNHLKSIYKLLGIYTRITWYLHVIYSGSHPESFEI